MNQFVEGIRQTLHVLALGAVICAAALTATGEASGQSLKPKRALIPETGAEPCPVLATPAPASIGVVAVVDSLLAAGSRAAILGDNYTAGELLQQAAGLDPGNPVIAYRLARTYEERGEMELAIGEYCRYLLVAPQADDSQEVRERIEEIRSTAVAVNGEELAAAMRAGLRAFDQRRYEAAALAFSQAITIHPGWGGAYYNRALARSALREDQAAIADLEQYLELVPAAEDREPVLAHVGLLRSGSAPRPARFPGPVGAFTRGLVIPGFGQQATGRPLAGLLVLASAAGAVYWGLQEETVLRSSTAVDPFGNPYDVQVRSLERTNLAAGVGVAATVAVAGALEAYLYAHRRRSDADADAGDEIPPAQRTAQLRFRLSGSAEPGRLELGFGIRASP